MRVKNVGNESCFCKLEMKETGCPDVIPGLRAMPFWEVVKNES